MRHPVWLRAGLVRLDPYHLGNDVPRLAEHNDIPDAQPFFGDKILVMQRCPAHRRPRQRDGIKYTGRR